MTSFLYDEFHIIVLSCPVMNYIMNYVDLTAGKVEKNEKLIYRYLDSVVKTQPLYSLGNIQVSWKVYPA